MARHRGSRVVIRGHGVAGPLDRLADVGPSEERPPEAPEPTTPREPEPPVREALEKRLERWFEERERFERHASAKGTSPKARTPAEPGTERT